MYKQKEASVALVITTTQNPEILLTQRIQPTDEARHGKWHLPGGSVNLDENPDTALGRELKEELGWFPDSYSVIDRKNIQLENDEFEGEQVFYHLYLVVTRELKPLVDQNMDPESDRSQWFSLGDIVNLNIFPLVTLALELFRDKFVIDHER